VQPGDIIVADLDGIVAIPQDLVEQVIINCEKYVAIDDQCMKALKEGHGVKETFAKYRGT
jgi:regulator of RNase E activity RraA